MGGFIKDTSDEVSTIPSKIRLLWPLQININVKENFPVISAILTDTLATEIQLYASTSCKAVYTNIRFKN